MVEKMKYINLTGPCTEVDRAMEEYLSRYDIQLESAVKELVNERELTGFTGQNPYTPMLQKAEAILAAFGLDVKKAGEVSACISREHAIDIINDAGGRMDNRAQNLRGLVEQRELYLSAAAEYEHFEGIEFQFEDLTGFEYLRYHFGRLPLAGFNQFKEYLYKSPEILIIEGKEDDESLWCAYFTTDHNYRRVESIFSSLHFVKASLPGTVGNLTLKGTPREICAALRKEAAEINELITRLMSEEASTGDKTITKEDILLSYHKLSALNMSFDARKYAAVTTNQFFIYVGWMTERDAKKLQGEIRNEKDLSLIIEDNNPSILSKPPTKLKNLKVFRPFEFFVKMYGLPSYAEVDPTVFVALTYALLFGVMFADIGQGAVITLAGLLMWRLRRLALGKVMTVIGCGSMVTGLLFGSIFGYEFTPLLLRPAEPDNLMNILMYAVAIGVFLILTSITFNIINAVKTGRFKEIIFSPNGPAGLAFYTIIAICALSLVTGGGMPAGLVYAAVGFLILIAAKGPLTSLVKGQAIKIHGSIPMYIFETIIELFETALSYFTNTVSYLRVGAFAISHASIMGIVWMLSKTAAGSNNLVVLVFGNLLVIALEGLIVGIQVLRLEFYEMFSRFYEGGGHAFEPYAKSRATAA